MSFLDNLASQFGVGEELSPCPYRFRVYGDRGGYFEGITGVVSFSREQIVLSSKDIILRINGRQLSISKLYKGDLAISGIILCVEVQR